MYYLPSAASLAQLLSFECMLSKLRIRQHQVNYQAVLQSQSQMPQLQGVMKSKLAS